MYLGPWIVITLSLIILTGIECFVWTQEDELRNSGSKEWEHLKDPLYVFIEARGPPNLAKAKMAAAIAEVKKMLIPQASILIAFQ